ncbi:cytosolic phospholipase A2 gamma-like isoform X2 [Pseudorasbora parva]|uniref:cytosolic phospholipase A2 gamma-like isoform X2 n=1 Tax=Pseudorasbora parva TaxID=51549 RepID=UPI00351E5CDB
MNPCLLILAWSLCNQLSLDAHVLALLSSAESFIPDVLILLLCNRPQNLIICDRFNKMSASKPQESGEVRIQSSLNKNEEEFVARRRNSIQQSLKILQIESNQNEVPNIALLGSGGGQRAMVGLLGSMVQLHKVGLLDCVLYLSGVSGSTWCMASLYQEPDWSTKLEAVKDKIVQRLNGPKVSWTDAFSKLKKYYQKDCFSLTDVWAVMVVTTFVKEIDEHTLTQLWNQQGKDPFPIYTLIDKQSKQGNEGDPWFEITPHEAGYSLTGAFVDTSNFGSQFHKGSKKNPQDEFDMLYLQALCGSALADEEEIKKHILQKIKGLESAVILEQDAEECYQVLMDLVDRNLSVLNGKDPSAFEESIRETRNGFSGGQRNLEMLIIDDKEEENLNLERYTMDVLNGLSKRISAWPLNAWVSIMNCFSKWIWGRHYNFLHKMTAWPAKTNSITGSPNLDILEEAVSAAFLESETRDFEDAGLLLNSPYFSVLREERNIDLIISLDFSDGDPFMTVRETAKACKERNIPFPEVIIPSEDLEKPKDFYVFKGQSVPTVIHIPLFNEVNCGDQIEAWRSKYSTFQGSYSAEMISDLMEVAGKNITNNAAKVVEEIRAMTKI